MGLGVHQLGTNEGQQSSESTCKAKAQAGSPEAEATWLSQTVSFPLAVLANTQSLGGADFQLLLKNKVGQLWARVPAVRPLWRPLVAAPAARLSPLSTAVCTCWDVVLGFNVDIYATGNWVCRRATD